MSETSIGDLVRRIRRELEDEPWEDYATSSVAADATTVPVNEGAAWAEGDVGEWNDDSFEQFKVRVGGSSSLTVKPGHNDTDSVAHADNAVVLKNPKVNGWFIVSVLEETLSELWPYAWAVRSTTLTPVLNQSYYTLPADLVDVISVTQKQVGTPTSYVAYGTRGSSLPIAVSRGLPVADVGSGNSLMIQTLDNTTNAITLQYRAFLSMSDIEDGLLSSAMVWGAMTKLALAADTTLIRQTIPQNAISGLRQSLGYQQRFEDVRRQLHYELERTFPPARVYVG